MKKGDIVTIGRYTQTKNEEVLPIEWRVLDVEDGHALLVSKYALECMPYNKQFEPTNWESCTLRHWLNNDFYNIAFTDEEKSKIVECEVSADSNPNHNTDQGPATNDKVFLLSVKQAQDLFDDDDDRICFPTAYANKMGVWKWDKSGACDNWLRTIGGSEYGATDIIIFGTIRMDGASVRGVSSGVRPAIVINC